MAEFLVPVDASKAVIGVPSSRSKLASTDYSASSVDVPDGMP